MNEPGTSATTDELPPKKRVPTWVWVVGAGCLFLLAIAITGLIVGGLYVKRIFDPELQWPRVATVLPFDHQPEGWTIMATPVPVEGADIWLLTSKDAQRQVMLMHYAGERAQTERARLFDSKELGADVAGLGKVGRFDPRLGTILVQGREVRCVRTTSTPQDAKDEAPSEVPGEPTGPPEKHEGLLDRVRQGMVSASVTLDLTRPEAKDELTVVILTHRATRMPVSDQEVVEFLKPFQIGPERK